MDVHKDVEFGEGLWPSRCPEDQAVNKTEGIWQQRINRCKDFLSDEIHVSTAPGHSGSAMLPFDRWISTPQKRTHRAKPCEFAVSAAWEGGPCWEQHWVEGITQGRWAMAGPGGMGWGRGELSGDFQCWAGENSREGGNAGWAKLCGMGPRKGDNIAGIWRHQRWFSTAGFNSWICLLCWLWDCTVAGMGANYLLAILNPCGLARG